MKLRHLEYFVAAEELNFTHAADRLHGSQPPFSKQIQDLEGELGVNLFQRERKGVALTAAGKAFLIDARGILEACDRAVKKAQRISRGELGELTLGHMAALTHVVFRDLLAPKPVKIPLGAVWKKNGLYSGVVSKFVTALSQVCAAAV